MSKISIRKANPQDATVVAAFMKRLEEESQYLLHEPDEKKNYERRAELYLNRICSDERSAVLLAFNEKEELIGFICGEGFKIQRKAHVMQVNAGILKGHQKKGLGKELCLALHEEVKRKGILRFETSIIKENEASLKLAKSLGLDFEGVKKESIRINDRYYDEYLLSIVLH